MGDIFSKLLEESDQQRKQLQGQASAALSMKPAALPNSPFPPSAPPVSEPATDVLPMEELQPPPLQESKQASLQASNIASKQATLLAKMREQGQLKATNAATFRFPPDLLEKLAEIEYQLHKSYKMKTTKNMIVVGALALLLLEFEENAMESNLYQFLRHE
jgi:hypothetical protein